MTDHRPEVRELLVHDVYKVIHALHKSGTLERCWMQDCDCEKIWKAIKAATAIAAPPIEPVGVRAALQKAYNFIDGSSALPKEETLEVLEAAILAASEKPVVDEVREVSELGFCSARLRDMGLTSSNRVRVVVWREER